MPTKLLGIALIAAGLLLRHRMIRAHRRGYLGPRYRRVHRDAQRLRFTLALGSQLVGAMICFAGAFLCLTHILVH